ARLRWLQKRRPDLTLPLLTKVDEDGEKSILSLVDKPRLQRVLDRMFDPNQFLSRHGIRSLSAAASAAISTRIEGQEWSIAYEPGESTGPMFGGNSNWRGPVWFPVNIILTDRLRTLGRFFGDDVTVEYPPGSGERIDLLQAARHLEDDLVSLFRPVDGRRPADGQRIEATDDPLWRDHITFNEYFDGDTGEGLGTSHQGWTSYVVHFLARRRP
ncbi:MGH1-like glycoside hydrolase domain-containing protein, partial [Kineococcus aurantiacus]